MSSECTRTHARTHTHTHTHTLVTLILPLLDTFRIYKLEYSTGMAGSKNVPGMMIWHCNARIYGNAYLITFKVWSLRACTHTHTYTHTCSIDPATVGSTGGRLLLESSGVRTLHSFLCPSQLRNVSPWDPFLEQGTVKSHWERDPESMMVGWWHNKGCVARCVIAMLKPLSLPAICRTAYAAKLAQ
jgi:hypothetical protein